MGPGWSQEGAEMGPRPCRNGSADGEKSRQWRAPFAKSSGSLGLMTDANATRLLFRRKRPKLYPGRGEVYSWLRAHHAEVSEMLARGELSWAMLAAEMIRVGVKGRRGEVPTPKAAARVWRRVCRDVEQAALAAGPLRRKYPSRISPDWRPQVVAPAQLPLAQDAANERYDPDEQLARIRRIIAERSGRKA